jgi:hypothetical protein
MSINRHMRWDNLQDQAQRYDPALDRFNQAEIMDTRKPAITLLHLNKLKKMRAARDLENLVRRDVLELLYGAPSEEVAPGM